LSGGKPTETLLGRAAKGERQFGGVMRDTAGIANPSVEDALLIDPVTKPKKITGARTYQTAEISKDL
jgi:hypothetical protein